MMRWWIATLILAACASGRTVDLSGPWQMHRGQTVSAVELPFQLQPSGRFRLERTVEIPDDLPVSGLALTPGTIRGAYELVVNGESIDTVGLPGSRFSPLPRPRISAVPESAARTRTLRISIAVDFPAEAWMRLNEREVIRARPMLGPRAELLEQQLAAGDRFLLGRSLASANVAATLMLIVLLWLFTRHGRDRDAVNWLLVALIANVSFDISGLLIQFGPGWLPLQALMAYGSFIIPLYKIFSIEFCVQIARWPVSSLWRLAYYGAIMASFFLLRILFRPAILLAESAAILYAWRTPGRRGACPVIALMIAVELLVIVFPEGFSFGYVPLGRTPTIRVFLGYLALIELSRRASRDRVERERLDSELRAARTAQQLLLPQPITSGALTAEVSFEPAREVGGDFCQIAEQSDGALLVLVGDVSGKGLEAAMTASVVVGAFRFAVTHDPAELLEGLNRTLIGHGRGGFVTCCCARIDASGAMVLASAGHPSPYLDACEIALEPGLPLGLAAEARYSATTLRIESGSQMTLISDGVLEAANAAGELFGFERTRAIARRPAAEIAATAQAWGQNDDVTVVTVRVAG